jgi:subtilisin-like proprotein convertase family protein
MNPALVLALSLASGAPYADAAPSPSIPTGRARALAEARPIEDAPAGVPIEIRAVAFAVSPTLREVARRAVEHRKEPPGEEARHDETVRRPRAGWEPRPDAALQDIAPLPSIPAPLASFNGATQADNASLQIGQLTPPDTNGDVGPSHYVQMVNLVVKIFDKSGGLLLGPVKASSFWASLGGICANDDSGDPVVLYDQLADRWLISQFNFTASNAPPYHECVAISKTGDPTGAWYQYDFQFPGNEFPDYPHFGVWPDGYYMTTNQFYIGGPFDGVGAYAFDRKKMLAGDPTANAIYFNENFAVHTEGYSGMLPSDHDGFAAPPPGTPNLFAYFTAQAFGDPVNGLRFFQLVPSFANPASSTFTEYHTTRAAPLAVAAFDPSAAGIPQPGGTVDTGLAPITDRLMHRFAYRNYGDHESWAVTHTVGAPASSTYGVFRAAPRYYELRRTSPGAALTVYDQSTYAPNDGLNRWMGSAAMDGEGNLALGFSVASSSVSPGIRYAGRLATDPLGGLMQGENTLVSGGGSQTSTGNRWGDYSALSVDPVDDCTFWYTQEYYAATTAANWATRIGRFKVDPGCATPARGTLSGTVTTCAGGAPVAGAVVWVSDGHSATTANDGTYSLKLPPGNYTVTATSPLALCAASTPVNATVTNGQTTNTNLCTACLPRLQPTGTPSVSAESCVAANGSPDPGETVTMSFSLKNNGLSATSNLVATLLSGGGVGSPSAPVSYGAIAANGGTASRSFTFKVGVGCSETFTPTFHLQDGATDLGTVSFSVAAGAPVPGSGSFSTGNVTTLILDKNSIDVPITVNGAGVVSDIKVKVRLNHTSDSDLILSLVAPDATSVVLANKRGGTGDNYGSGSNDCNGTPTVFDDAAATPISAGTAPFAGTYQPDSPLSAFAGKPIQGTWKLHVEDTLVLDTGTVYCVSLVLNSHTFTCCGSFPKIAEGIVGAPSAESCGSANGQVDPGEQVTLSFPLKNVGTAATTNLTASLQVGGGIVGVGGPQSYGALTTGGATVFKPFTFTALGTCGGKATATLKLSDGVFDLGTATFDIPLGHTTAQQWGPFSNANAIAVPGALGATTGSASPYPAIINVAGVNGVVTALQVKLLGVTHPYPADVDVLLVGPTGAAMTLVSDTVGGADWNGVTLTLNDTASLMMPGSYNANSHPGGTFRPTDYVFPDSFTSPAPTRYNHAPTVGNATLASVFGETNPNGSWRLYVFDDAAGDAGSIAGGWQLTMTTRIDDCCATTCAFAGDANGDGVRDVADVFYLLNRLFAGGVAPLGCCDMNGDGKLDVSDVFYYINWLFAGGPPPV